MTAARAIAPLPSEGPRPGSQGVLREGPMLLALLMAITLVYGGSLFGGFVWDDASVVLPAAARRPAEALSAAFSGGVAVDGLALGYFRPLVDMSYAMDGWLWGRQPFGFHLTNLLLYAFGVALAHRLARRLLGPGLPSGVAAAIFALHPVHVEPVAWIQGRGDLLAFLGVTAALLAFHRALQAPRPWPWWLAAGGVALGGALAKEWALMAPILAAAWWALLGRREGVPTARAWRGLLSFAPALLLYGALRLLAHAGSEVNQASPLLAVSERWLILPIIFTRYVRLLLWPHPLKAYYIVPPPSGPLDLRLLGGGALLAATLGAALWGARKVPRFSFALWWFLLSLLPVLPMMPIKGFAMAERYLFLPSFGFAMGLGLLAERTWCAARARAARWAVGAVALAVAMAWSAVAAARVPDWVEPVAFYRAMVREAPDSPFALNNLGALLIHHGEIEEGTRYLERALAVQPDMGYAYAGLGVAHWKRGDAARAAAFIGTAVRLRPRDPPMLALLAASLEAQGRLREAAAARDRLGGVVVDPMTTGQLLDAARETLGPLGREGGAEGPTDSSAALRPSVGVGARMPVR